MTDIPHLRPLDKDEAPAAPNPELRRYEYTFRDGNKKIVEGYLVVTNSFIASGKGDGDIVFWAPSDSLLTVEFLGYATDTNQAVN